MLSQHVLETNDYYITQPCLLIEVLSTSTAITDRREKLLYYKPLLVMLKNIRAMKRQKQVK